MEVLDDRTYLSHRRFGRAQNEVVGGERVQLIQDVVAQRIARVQRAAQIGYLLDRATNLAKVFHGEQPVPFENLRRFKET